MGNYYSGMMNATGGSELKHHGILGQKWGVRRFQNPDGTWTEAGKKRRMSGYKDRRVENYLSRTNDSDKLAKYESLDRSDRNRVFKAVRDLEGPHGHRGEMESKNFRSINPLKQRIARQMRDNRLNRGQKVMDELLGENAQAEVAYTGQPKKGKNGAGYSKDNLETDTGRSRKSFDTICDAHSKVTRDMPGGGSIKDIRKNLMSNAKNDSERVRIQKNENKLREIIQNGVDSSEVNAAEKRMNDFRDKHMKGLIVTKKNQQIYQQLQDDFRKANENAWYNLSDSVQAYVSKLPKNEQAQWYAMAYKEMGLDW